MKTVLALCFLGVASAAVIPITYNAAGVIPYTGPTLLQQSGYLPYNNGFTANTGIIPNTANVLTYNTAGAGIIPNTANVLTYNTATAGIIPNTANVLTYNTANLPATAGIFPQAGFLPYTGAIVQQTAAVAPGYVAKTLGTEHVAPLPAGSSNYASHHINVAKAPGTV